MRKVYYQVIITNQPDKFEKRLTESREYSHKLKVNFKVTDFLNSIALPALAMFF